MQSYEVIRGQGAASLSRTESAPRALAADEVRVRVHAVALNYRDLLVAEGKMGTGDRRVPCSDAAGVVLEVGEGISRFQPGDRVMPTFFPDWIDGPPEGTRAAKALGGNIDGVLAEQVVAGEQALVKVPEHLSFEEASTLPCAGLTAWNALRVDARLRAGGHVLLLGTGGVSTWALQLAKAMGLRVSVTSSNDGKLARARELGADHLVNYRSNPQWHEEIVRTSGGRGVDLTVEVGGQDTIARSIAATRMGGTVALVGGVTGGFGVTLDPFALAGDKRLAGVLVGSRVMLEELAQFVAQTRLRPAVDRVFGFDEARNGFAHLATGGHFGKVVVRIA